MRLWHQDLITKLPRQQLLGQNRECASLRGLGWGRKHATVNYVFKHDYQKLVDYHYLIMQEMLRRGYEVRDLNWLNPWYRGKRVGFDHNVKYENRIYNGRQNIYQ